MIISVVAAQKTHAMLVICGFQSGGDLVNPRNLCSSRSRIYLRLHGFHPFA